MSVIVRLRYNPDFSVIKGGFVMTIYHSDSDFFFFDVPYNAKRLLNDSVSRTLQGFSSIGDSAFFTGCGHILLARVESVASCALVTFSSALLMVGSLILTPFFLIPAIVLNLGSRIPGISSFQAVQNFTQTSSDVIYRIGKVYLIAIPVILLFVSTSIINTLLPGILKTQNVFFDSIHWMVESLGPLKRIRAIVPGVTEIVGTYEDISFLEGIEDFFRSLSYQNYLHEVTFSELTEHYSYSRSY